jgi:glycosyltransferase involved in cell wall biosynthesis
LLISICIPAYSRTHFLQRLLNSIAIQTFTNYEVIITDDSPGTEVTELVKQYTGKFPLIYHKNPITLGTPENWNEAVRHASGEWIKIMHDDDWFAEADSLELFVQSAEDGEANFIFSAYRSVYENGSAPREMFLSRIDKNRIAANPAILLSTNFIGPPSACMYKNNKEVSYDKRLKWLVDLDFYIRYPGIKQSYYIAEPLVNVGVHSAQVTASSFKQRSVEIPEYLYELDKLGIGILQHAIVFDAYWRVVRNFGIRHAQEIREVGYDGDIPPAILAMIKFQRPFPRALLKLGLFSKLCMFACYLYCRYIKKLLR